MIDTNGAQASDPAARGALGAWWWQGLRTAVLMRADWRGLRATPGIVAVLVIVPWMAGMLFERLYIDGAATFYWPGLLVGWVGTAVTAWLCWLLVAQARTGGEAEPASAASLFAMLCAQALAIEVACGLVIAPIARSGAFAMAPQRPWIWWSVSIILIGWYAIAQLALMWRSTAPSPALRVATATLLIGAMSIQWLQPIRHWYPDISARAKADTPEPLRLTQELMELQPRLLDEKLQAIAAQRPGIVDVYAITFAPYAEEGVFRRESDLVASVMQERFGAAGRSIELINHPDTARQWPWATPLNLKRAIQRAAQRMDRDEDVLFIHLTSHGARSGQLAAWFWPLTIDPVTPQLLKGWLDEAGVRHRVISVSACYSGSWIEPLSDPDTLVMTAADADHTSYGCGSGSTLTYFGRAMFDEQLRHTWSFEKAHAAARTVIEQREHEAGKSDGFSNPQIRVGERIRERLSMLEAQQQRGE
jgi:hypothetical protein